MQVLCREQTSLPIIAIDGTGRSHGTSPSPDTSKGLVHSSTSVAATISFFNKCANNQSYVTKLKKIITNFLLKKYNTSFIHELPKYSDQQSKLTLSATGSRNAPNAVPNCIYHLRKQKIYIESPMMFYTDISNTKLHIYVTFLC